MYEYDQFARNISYVFFDMFLLFVRFIEDRYKDYKINTRYTSVLKLCYNVIYLQFLLCFGAETEIMIFVYILLCLPWHTDLEQISKCSRLYYLPSTKHLIDNRGNPIKASNTKNPSNNRGQTIMVI